MNTVFYGLPKDIQYCKKCLVNNQKPTMRSEHSIKKGDKNRTVIFENGICEACRVNELKKKIDWKEREYQFKNLLDKYRVEMVIMMLLYLAQVVKIVSTCS